MTDVTSGAFRSVVTDLQVEATRKLAIIGWRWNEETVQKGLLRLKNRVESELPGRHKAQSVLVAVIEPNGAVLMGDVGVPAKPKRPKK